MVDEGDWRAELDRWLETFLAEMNHAAWRAMCPPYIAGLIGLGERKSMQPMAARQDGLSYDRLQHVEHANDDPKPFRCTASAVSIMAKLRVNQSNDSEH